MDLSPFILLLFFQRSDLARAAFGVDATGGARQITDDGHVIGSFTDCLGEKSKRVYFYRIESYEFDYLSRELKQ